MAERMCPECGEMSDEFNGRMCIHCAAAGEEDTEEPELVPPPLGKP